MTTRARLGTTLGAWPRSRPFPGVAIDLGSARTRAWVPHCGLIVDAPTIIFSRNGISYPVHRGRVVDAAAAARMLTRMLKTRPSPGAHPAFVVLTLPVLSGEADRDAAFAAVSAVLNPGSVLAIDSVKAAAIGANADLLRPLLVIDLGAHLTEVAILGDGSVVEARRTPLGTADLTGTITTEVLVESVVALITDLLRQDCGPQVVDALDRGPLLAGGGALRPAITYRLSKRLCSPVQPAPAPQTAAIRGASTVMLAAHRHPGYD